MRPGSLLRRLVPLVLVGTALCTAGCAALFGEDPAQARYPPAAVWIPDYEDLQMATQVWPCESPDDETGFPGMFFWVGEPNTRPGAGRLVIVPPGGEETWLSNTFYPSLAPLAWERGRMFVATSETTENRDVVYVRFDQDPKPIDAKALHDQYLGKPSGAR